MSAEHSYEWSTREQERTRAEALAEQRRLYLAQLRLELAERQGQDRAAVAKGQRQLQEAGQQASNQDAHLHSIQNEAAGLNADVRQQSAALEHTRTAITRARAHLEQQIAAAKAMSARTDDARDLLAGAIEQASSGLAASEAVAASGTRLGDTLSHAEATGRHLVDTETALVGRISQLEMELGFLDRYEHTRPAAMALLAGMEANGYRLHETLTRGELTAYFSKADSEHQIGVQLRPEQRPGEQTERWELLVETFGMVGNECVGEIDDFDSAMEWIDLGELVSGGTLRNYPKAERHGELERRGSLPRPCPVTRRSGAGVSKTKVRT